MGKKKRDLRKKREEKKQKRKKGIFESGQKIYYQFVETGPSVEQMLNNPMMMLFLQHGKVKELIEEFANKLPHPCSNNHRTNIEMLRMTLFMIMGGYSSPEDFNAKVSGSERNHYNIKIGVTTYYDWLERIKECEQVLNKFVERTATLFLSEQKSASRGIVVDIDASYKDSKIGWCKRNYKGDHSFRLLFTHVSREKTGAKAILKVDVDPGNISPATGIYETLRNINERHRLSLFRSDSAAYNTNVTNYLDSKGIDWMIGADLDSAVTETIGCINNYEPYFKEDVKTNDKVGSTGHAMGKSDKGFVVLNKRVKLSSLSEQVSFMEVMGEKYKNLPIAVSSGYVQGRTLSETRHDYECRGGQESMIANFKHFYDVKAKESIEKTKVWINLLASAYNLSLYFLRKEAQKKTMKLPDILEPPSLLFLGELLRQEEKSF